MQFVDRPSTALAIRDSRAALCKQGTPAPPTGLESPRKEAPLKPMYLPAVEAHDGEGARADLIRRMRGMGATIPQLLHLFAYKPHATEHLERFTQEVMRGPSPLSPGERELIAAFVSSRNHCAF
jgi:hypothetical protein